jgi:nicotinamide-nucleotide amidase
MTVEMEIICVGNELLIGKTLNTNAQWLSRRATSMGVAVKRITVVGDEINEIASMVREALKRRPRYIIATGGLGPTFDDKTLEGIAKGLKKKLRINRGAMKMVREKYESLRRKDKKQSFELTPARIKMATLPVGTKPLHNSVGTAPGMMVKVGNTFLIALPGVPPEMEAIFVESVEPMFKKETERSGFFEASIYADGIVESSLAPLIDDVMEKIPSVYIKSHVYAKSYPSGEGERSHIELHFSTTSKDFKTAHSCLDMAMKRLTELVEKSGGKVEAK